MIFKIINQSIKAGMVAATVAWQFGLGHLKSVVVETKGEWMFVYEHGYVSLKNHGNRGFVAEESDIISAAYLHTTNTRYVHSKFKSARKSAKIWSDEVSGTIAKSLARKGA